MFNKSIFQGRFFFNNERSFDKAHKMYLHRLENYHKSIDIVFDPEEIFIREKLAIVIPRTVINILEKSFKSTATLLEYTAQFAICGQVGAWMMTENGLKYHSWIEPKNDKATVQNFQKALAYIEDEDNDAAIQELDKILLKCPCHAQAFERRGALRLEAGQLDEAIEDFKSSLELDDESSLSYIGLGKAYMEKNDWDSAAANLHQASKTSLALQDIHWTSRRLLSQCFVEKEMWEEAEFQLRFFVKRKFDKESANYAYRKDAITLYGKVLMELDRFAEALDQFEKAIEIEEEETKDLQSPELLVFRGMARKNMGKKGFLADWKKASDMGYNTATELLTQVSA